MGVGSEHVYAAIRGCSVKVLQRERQQNRGCRFRRVNGTTIPYKMGDITEFMDASAGVAAAPKTQLSHLGAGGADREICNLTAPSTPINE